MPDTHAPQQLEPWQWSEEHWRKLVAQVRAGKRYRPTAWKDGARCAVALSFDSDHETNELRDVGMRTPSWDFSPNTLAIQKEMGLFYDSSLMADEDCYELLLGGDPTGVVELPVEWVRDDAVYFSMNRFASLRPYTPPTDVFETFRPELDAAWEEGRIFHLTMHPHIIGYRSRIWIVDELIRHAKSKRQGNDAACFATHQQVA